VREILNPPLDFIIIIIIIIIINSFNNSTVLYTFFQSKTENIGIVEGEGQKQSLCKATSPNVQVLRY
jgi:ABC-type lipoprotein release transport system permease subunit